MSKGIMQIDKIVEKYNILWYYLNMEYKLVRTQRKTLTIKIDTNCNVIVLAPKKCSLNFINNIVNEKKLWIEKNINNIKQKNEKIKEFSSLEKIFILGRF